MNEQCYYVIFNADDEISSNIIADFNSKNEWYGVGKIILIGAALKQKILQLGARCPSHQWRTTVVLKIPLWYHTMKRI